MADLGMDPVDTMDSNVLASATLAAQLEGNTNRAVLRDLRLDLDDSRIDGQVTIDNFSALAIRFDVNIDAIDLIATCCRRKKRCRAKISLSSFRQLTPAHRTSR